MTYLLSDTFRLGSHSNFISSPNILINDNGNPLLGDFGLSKVSADKLKILRQLILCSFQTLEGVTGDPMTNVQGVDASFKWFAPEALDGKRLISTSSDVYSFAMTVLEVRFGWRRNHPLLNICNKCDR